MQGQYIGISYGDRMRKILSLLLLVVTVLVLTSCTPKLSLTIEEADKTVALQVGQTKSITAVVSKGNTLEWQSNSTNIATVSASTDTFSATITAVEAGTAKITVKVAGKELQEEITVTVTRPEPTSVAITGEGDLPLGGTLKLTGAVSPANATQTLTWSSSDTAKATVDNTGLVTAVAAGRVTITATSVKSTVKAEVEVRVVVPQPTAVTVTGPDSVEVPGSIQLVGTVAPDYASQGVLWSVDDTTLATISTSGELTALKEGTVVVTATAVAKTSIKGTKTITLTLPDPTEVVISGPTSLAALETAQYTAVVSGQYASQVVKWSTSDVTKATIDENTGLLTGVAAGTVKVIATSAVLDTVFAEFEITVDLAKINVEMDLSGAYWPITGTDVFILSDPIKTATFKGSYNSTSANYYRTEEGVVKGAHLDSFFLNDKDYKMSPSVWQNRVFLDKNANGFYEIKEVIVAGGSNANPSPITKYEYVLFAHSAYAAAYNFFAELQVGQVVTLNGFDINSVGMDMGQVTINVYNKEQAISTADLIIPGGTEVVLPIPGKHGYKFVNWFANPEFTGDPVTKADESIKVYAKWEYDLANIAVAKDVAPGTTYYSETTGKYYVEGGSLFATLEQALAAVQEGGTIVLEAGNHTGSVTLNKNNITIVASDDAEFNAQLNVAANVDGLTIDGVKFIDKAQIIMNVAGGVKNFTFTNNLVTDLTISTNTFLGFKNDGTANNENFVIKNNQFLIGESLEAPRWIRGGNISNLTVVNNIFTGIPGIYVDAIRIEGNNETNSAGIGLGGEVTITGNEFNKIGQRGVWIKRISATLFHFENNLIDQNGGVEGGGGLQLEVLAPETVLKVNILKNEFKNITHFFGISLGTAATPVLGEVVIENNKFVEFDLSTAVYMNGYTGASGINANNNFYSVLPTEATMPLIPAEAYLESFDTLTVTFDSLGGPAVEKIEVPVMNERVAAEPTAPTRVGYTFDGWYTTNTFTKLYDFASRVDFPITLYAKWTLIKYDITYNLDGGEFGSSFENKAEMLVEFMDDLYTFVAPTESKSDFIHGVDKTSGYDGLWHSKYKELIYNGTRPEAPNSDLFISHPDYMEKWLPFFDHIQAFVKIVNAGQNFFGDTFVGFIRIRQYIINVKPAAFVTDATMASYPAAYQVANTYTYDKELVLVNPVKEGYLFLGWYNNAEFTGDVVTKINANSTGAVTLYAKWTESVTVTFANVDDSPIIIRQIEKGAVVVQPADPTRFGYTFVAWYADKALTTEFVFDLAANADVTIFAKWDENVVNINYELNGGEWSWTVADVTTPGAGINAISTLPTIFMQDLYKYLKDNDLLEAEGVDANLRKTTWEDFSKSYTDPYAIYNWNSSAAYGGSYDQHTGYNQFFYDTASGNDTTLEITEIVGGFLGTEPYKTKYANLASHLSLMLPLKYSELKFWGGATAKAGMAFMLDGYFYGTQGAGTGKFAALRSKIPTTSVGYEFDGEVLVEVVKAYQALTDKVTSSTMLVAPSRVGYTFEGWYTNAAFTGSPVTVIAEGSLPAAKYYAKWKDIRYEKVPVTLEVNGALVGTYVQATRFDSVDWSGNQIVLRKASIGAAWYQLVLKPTENAGFYQIVAKGTGATHAEGKLWLGYHDLNKSPYRSVLTAQYSAAKVGDLLYITNIPEVATNPAEIDILFKPSTEAVVKTMFAPEDLPVLTKAGFTFGGWYDNAEFTGEAITQYPGFEGSSVPADLTYYAKWIAEGGEVVAELEYDFDFSTLAENTSYVNTLTSLDVNNKVDSQAYAVERLNANISTSGDFTGIVLGIRSKNNFDDAMIQTGFAASGLQKIEYKMVNWNTDASYNFDAFVEKLVIEVSTDKTTWTEVADLTEEHVKTAYAVNEGSVELTVGNDPLYVRINAISKDNIESTYQLRLIVQSLKLYTVE